MEKNIVTGSNSKIQSLAFRIRGIFALKDSADGAKFRLERGFSLLELMIGMFILIILLSVAIPTYQRSVQHARETVLEQNLWQMRRSIDQYATDKGKLPQNLQELVDQGYLREMPIDPMNDERAEWNEITGEDKYSGDGSQGLVDVKSMATGVDGNRKNYSDY